MAEPPKEYLATFDTYNERSAFLGAVEQQRLKAGAFAVRVVKHGGYHSLTDGQIVCLEEAQGSLIVALMQEPANRSLLRLVPLHSFSRAATRSAPEAPAVAALLTGPDAEPFDPATQVISGTPLRGDVNCRSDQWHPAVDRCREGGFHLVRLAVSDYTFVVYQEFIVHVLPNDSPLLEADRSFHWPTLREINAVRVAAQRDAYHLQAGPALAAPHPAPQHPHHQGKRLLGARLQQQCSA